MVNHEQLTIHEAHQLLVERKVSSVELTEACLERIWQVEAEVLPLARQRQALGGRGLDADKDGRESRLDHVRDELRVRGQVDAGLGVQLKGVPALVLPMRKLWQ